MIDNSNQPRKDGGMWMIPIYIYYSLSKSLLGNEKKKIFSTFLSPTTVEWQNLATNTPKVHCFAF